MIAKHYEFPFPFLVTPARFPYPSFQPPCDKKSPIPHLDGVECKLLLKPQNMSYNRVWKGILIPQYCFFFHNVVSSRTSVISIPDTVFFPNTASRKKILANPAFRKGKRGQIPNPVKTFCVFPNPALQIPSCREKCGVLI